MISPILAPPSLIIRRHAILCKTEKRMGSEPVTSPVSVPVSESPAGHLYTKGLRIDDKTQVFTSRAERL